jgi:hypothetical protein
VPDQDRPTTLVQPIFGPGGSAEHARLRSFPPGPQVIPALGRWETSFPYDRFYFHGYTVTPEERRRQPVARALPEGELPSGAKASGFIYFTSGAYAEKRVILQANLIRQSGEPALGVAVARAAIPFRVK